MLVIDAVTRLIPGALGNEASSQNESFSENLASGNSLLVGAQHTAPLPVEAKLTASVGSHDSRLTNHLLLDFPHYTRPADFRGWKVPEVLIGGNHAEVANWRRAAALEKTQRNRPDLLLR